MYLILVVAREQDMDSFAADGSIARYGVKISRIFREIEGEISTA